MPQRQLRVERVGIPGTEMDFATVVERLSVKGESFRIDVPDDWLQGRTTFGGLTTALCLAAAQAADATLPPFRSAQVAFTGPVGGMVQVIPRLLRRGRSSAYVHVDVVSDGALACHAVLVFAASRPDQVERAANGMPAVPPPDACPDFFVKGAPAFARHFDARLAAGTPLGSGGGDARFVCWVRHRSTAPAPLYTRLVCLADTLPPALLAVSPLGTPASTMTWSFDVITPDDAIASGDGWHLLESRADSATGGYSAQAMSLWRADGKRILAGRQTVATFS